MYKKYEQGESKVVIFRAEDRTPETITTFVVCEHPGSDDTILALHDALGKNITVEDLEWGLPMNEEGYPDYRVFENPIVTKGENLFFVWHGANGLEVVNWILYWQDILTKDQMEEIIITAQSFFQ